MSESTQNSGITKEFGNVYCESVKPGVSDKNDIAVLRQEVETTYPATQGGNSKTSSLFGGASFGAGQKFGGKPRAAIIKVPTGTTVDAVNELISNLAGTPRLYRILSSNVEDVLTEQQIAMVESGNSELTMEDYKTRRMIKKDEESGEIILDPWGNVQYGATYFSDVIKEDEDHRVRVTDRVSMAETAEVKDNFLATPVAAEM